MERNQLNIRHVMKERIAHYNLKVVQFLQQLEQNFKDYEFSFVTSLQSNAFESLITSRASYYAKIRLTEKCTGVCFVVDFPFLIMIGSNLDFLSRVIRLHVMGLGALNCEFINQLRITYEDSLHFDVVIRVYTCFIVQGILRQFPLYMTNNSLNYHVVRVKKQVVLKKFLYNDKNKGYELKYCKDTDVLTVTDYHGHQIELSNLRVHVDTCCTCAKCHEIFTLLFKLIYKSSLEGLVIPNLNMYRQVFFVFILNHFSTTKKSIDHLGNKCVVEPAEFLSLLFFNDIVPHLSEWESHKVSSVLGSSERTFGKLVASRAKLVHKNLLSGRGCFHIFSQKTSYQKEICNKGKFKLLTKQSGVRFQDFDKRMGEGGEVFYEKPSTVFLSVDTSNFQLIPFKSNTVKKLLSDKVKSNDALVFNKSYSGFICPLYTTESKNVGKILSLCRQVYTSILPQGSEHSMMMVWDHVNSIVDLGRVSFAPFIHLLVLNKNPFPLDEFAFECLCKNLLRIKKKFKFIECYVQPLDHIILKSCKIIYINWENNILFKSIPEFPLHEQNGKIYVSPNDFEFWIHYTFPNETAPLESAINLYGMDFVSSWFTEFLCKSNHNLAQKNILFLNNLRNSILATDDKLSRLFKESSSIHLSSSKREFNGYETLFEPSNNLTKYFQVSVPLLNVLVTWYDGLNQEDSFIVNKNSHLVADSQFSKNVSLRFEITYTLLNPATKDTCIFKPTEGCIGHSMPICIGKIFDCTGLPLGVKCNTSSIELKPISDSCVLLYYHKEGNWEFVEYHAKSRSGSKKILDIIVTIERKMSFEDGDKICSFHGQKGVVVGIGSKNLLKYKCPRDGTWKWPDLVMHPESILKRQTMGQMLEYFDPEDENCIYPSQVQVSYPHEFQVDSLNVVHETINRPGVMFFKSKFIFINYKSFDNMNSVVNCKFDTVSGQPTKGANRGGSYRLGTMEIKNCFMCTGLATFLHEKCVGHSDSVDLKSLKLTKGIIVSNLDAMCLKCQFVLKTKKCIKLKRLKCG
jgi:RNA polymerase Rpb2, domain 6